MAYQVDKFELVELQVNAAATATRYFFPDLPKLRAKMMTGIETYFDSTITFAPSSNPLVISTILQTAFVVFYTNGTQDLWRIPWPSMNRTQNIANDPFVRDKFILRPQSITWDKSYIELSAIPAFGVNSSFLMGVYYS